MKQLNTQVLILGGGPGGYSCALRAAQLGLDVLLVEPARAGGTCLHSGCIPSKAFIHLAERYRDSTGASGLAAIGIRNAQAELDWSTSLGWKDSIVERLATGVDGLLAKVGVQRIEGVGEMQDGKRCHVQCSIADTTQGGAAGLGERIEVLAEHVVLATGAAEVVLPSLPAGPNVMYAKQALQLAELPATLAVVGGGYIGLELGQAFARLGVQVTVVEAQDRLLPIYPAALTQPVVKSLLADGVVVHTRSRATHLDAGVLHVDRDDGEKIAITAEKVLVAVGRKPNVLGWGCENLALDLAGSSESGQQSQAIAVDARCETSMSGVYAIGDLTGEPMLAHRAMAQGQVVAEHLSGRRREFSPAAIPAVCFTAPELASVGETAMSAKAAGMNVVVTRYPLAANARALTLGSNPNFPDSFNSAHVEGFVEVVADADDHVLLGVQVVGEHIAEMVHSFTLALEMGARLEDVADTIHAHPTLGETFAEASLAALGLPLHG